MCQSNCLFVPLSLYFCIRINVSVCQSEYVVYVSESMSYFVRISVELYQNQCLYVPEFIIASYSVLFVLESGCVCVRANAYVSDSLSLCASVHVSVSWSWYVSLCVRFPLPVCHSRYFSLCVIVSVLLCQNQFISVSESESRSKYLSESESI